MRKRFNLIFVLLLGVIMLLALVACNQNVNHGDLPDDVGGNNNGTNVNESASLKFTFPIEMSSVFNSIYVDEFELENYVEYTVVYRDEFGAVVREVPYGGVKLGMVAEEDKPKLSVVGHHNIRVTAELDDGTIVKGTFGLHLKDRSGAISLVNFTFDLNDVNGGGKAQAYFGSVNSMLGTATASVVQGYEFSSWSEFISTFNMGLSGKALVSVTTDKGVTLDASGEGFPFTVGASTTFTTKWTDDIVRIKFDLNKPEDAVLKTGASDPAPLFTGNGKYANMTAPRTSGRAVQPADEDVNVYSGYYFAGWFNKATNTLWRFSSAVGENDIELYARWTAADYSFTIYTMGGVFSPDLVPSTVEKDGEKITLTVDNASELGYTVIESSSRFSLTTNEVNRVTFTGFHYDVSYDKYVSEVTVSADGKKVLLKLSEFYRPKSSEQTIFVKGSGESLVIDELYNDYQCTDPLVRRDKVDAEQPVTYIKWVFNAPSKEEDPTGSIYLDRISKLYTEVIFKDGYTVMADGSVRLDKINDYALNELIVPATLFVRGQERPLTEIGEAACSNVRSLTKIDLSRAENLTTIGAQAFALDAYLKEIIMPSKNSINDIGDNAFMSTNYEDDYFKNTNGAEFIVINKMIYKFVGADKAVIDLSNPENYYNANNAPNMSPAMRAEFNAQLAGVERIEDGAFENCKSLVSVSLPRKVTTIENNAFSGLGNFENLLIPENSELTDIGESAFVGTRILSKNCNLYMKDYGAIVIGSVYYRLIDTSSTSAVVPKQNGSFVVTTIAPKAFVNCTLLEDVQFESEEKIVKIGTDAFLDTKYIQVETEEDSYTSVNGILTAYYAPNSDANKVNLIVPERVSTIASRAFGQYARYFRTVQINSNVKKIENYAFSGADMMVSVIFPDISVNGHNLVNAPSIEENAFANAKGEMPENVSLFFSTKVMELFKQLAGDDTLANSANEVTRNWLSLYKLHNSHFKEEDISLVEIDRTIIASVLMRKDTDAANNAFTDKYGKGLIDDALIITSTTGVARSAPLGWTANSIQLVEVTETNKYAALFVSGLKKYVLTYKYNDSTKGCPTEVGDPKLFVITVYDAVNGLPNFTTSQNYDKDGENITANGLNSGNSNFWLEGLDSQVKDSAYPTFYTSANANAIISGVRFGYKDINGVKHTGDTGLTTLRITGFRTNALATAVTATVSVNFYGLGTFVFDYVYNVTISRFETIEQDSAVVIPINGNAENYLRINSVNLVGQDGNKEAKPLNTFVIEAIDGNTDVTTVNTTQLGMHTMTIRYEGTDALGAPTLDVCYTVVLEADESLFRYQIINSKDKTARIIGCTARTAQTIVVPSVWKNGDQQYKIIQIGYYQDSSAGVFENFENLRSIYLPESIERLGVNTFAGCRRLRNVYTSIQFSADKIAIPTTDEYFKPAGRAYTEQDANGVEWTIQPVELISLDNLTYGDRLTIASRYVKDENKHEIYRIISIAEGLKINKPKEDIDIFLPDSIFRTVSMKDSNDKDITEKDVVIFTSGSDFVFKTENHVPSGLKEVKNGAFRNCEQLTNIDFSHATELNLIGAMAFASSGLTSIDLSKNVKLTEIENQLFEDAIALTRVVLNPSVRYIGISAFGGCTALESVTGYGNSLIYIGESAFAQCKSLTRIDIYSGVKTMGMSVFSTCGALTIYCHFDSSALNASDMKWNSNWNGSNCPIVWNCDTNEVASDNMVYVIVDGLRYAVNPTTGKATVAGQMFSLSGEVYIPDLIMAEINGEMIELEVTSIGANAFAGNDTLTSVVVTSSIKTIEQYAFQNCTSLLLFAFEDSNGLTSVSTTAFLGCDALAQRPTIEPQTR